MSLFYADSSALLKLVHDEPETDALRRFLRGADILSCELVLAELPRAIWRASAGALMPRVGVLLDALALRPVDQGLLRIAGAFSQSSLRTLDAVHLAAALDLLPHDGLVSYDDRQSAAARLAGLRTFAPGR